MLKKQAELLEEMRSEQSQYKTVKTTMEKQQRVYEKKVSACNQLTSSFYIFLHLDSGFRGKTVC